MSEANDVFGRPLRDLRISVTDRCNLRCPYCMPREVFGADHGFLPAAAMLTFGEISRITQAFCLLGVRKVRLTGGEPLLRKELPVLVGMLARNGRIEDLAMTTNGLLLSGAAQRLRDAGLHRVTVSLDALDDDLFRRLSGSDRPVTDVLAGLQAATAVGLPVKINCVVQRGVNEHQIVPLAGWCREEGHTLRFIEYMDVGNHNRWSVSAVVPVAEIRRRLENVWPLVAIDASNPGEVARCYRYTDGAGQVGFVASISEPFCRDCNRARLTADGKLVTCLFAADGADLKPLLRGNASDEDLGDFIRTIWRQRDDRYSELRAGQDSPRQKVEMSYVGG